MTPHIHRDLIIAWANGAEIQVEEPGRADGCKWIDCPKPSWQEGLAYRIKPKPATVRYRVALMGDCRAWTSMADDDKQARTIEGAAEFRRWLTDWQEVEA